MPSLQEIRVTPEQKAVLRSILEWLADKNRPPSLTIGGYAGTGKTTIIAALRVLLKAKEPKWKIAFAAYTGKASQVLAERLRSFDAKFSGDSISTLHSLLYSPIVAKGGDVAGWQRKEKLAHQLIIIDEASMVTEDIWKDVLRFGVPVLAVGDHGQLPPIGSEFSLMNNPDLELHSIHRQAAESPIIKVATLARQTGRIPLQDFGPGVRKYNAQSSEAQILLDEFTQTYKADTLFLVGFNRSRIRLNHTIRAAQWRNPEKPEPGDVLICLKNNWKKGIYNGLMVRVLSINKHEDEALPYPLYDVVLEDMNGRVAFSGPILASPFDPKHANTSEREELPKRLPPEVGVFDYGYALTVHKAQGSQAPKVIVLEERSQHMSDDDWRRWLYTAVTRAETELYIFGAEDQEKKELNE